MEIAIIIIVAFAASMLTFFSGFGLGTLLTPAFLLFFPLPIAISLTACVHFLNNVFKFGLIGSHVDKKVLLLFGLAAMLGVLPGVYLLSTLDHLPVVFEYELMGRSFSISWMGLVIGFLMILFSFSEFKKLNKSVASNATLIGGGLISGFFGGLSGYQGALRTSFLIRMNLTKEAFVATGVSIALLVDITRIPMYYETWMKDLGKEEWLMVLVALVPAFLGAWLGKKWLSKTSISLVRTIVGVMLVIFGIALMLGILS